MAGNSGEICYKLYSVTLKLKVKATPSIELLRTFSPVMRGSKASRVREGGKRLVALPEWVAESFYELRRDFIISKNTGKRRKVS